MREWAQVSAMVGAWAALWCYLLPQRSRLAILARWTPIGFLLAVIILTWLSVRPHDAWVALCVVFSSYALACEFRNQILVENGRTGSNIWEKSLAWVFMAGLSFFLLDGRNAFVSRPDPITFAACLLLALLCYLSFLLLLKQKWGFFYYQGYRSSARMGHLSCLLTALTEEYGFRALILYPLSLLIGPWPAVCVQALLFGLSHYRMGSPGGVVGALQSFALGLALGTITVASGTFVYAVLVHTALPIANQALRVVRERIAAGRRGASELLGCLCRQQPCLCMDAGRFRIPIARHVAELLVNAGGGESLSSERIAQLAEATACRGMKDTPRLLAGLAGSGTTIHFDKSLSKNDCPHWHVLRV